MNREAGRIVAREDLPTVIDELRLESKTIVFTNGCFDILHAGHSTYLQAAAALGDILVVGLNSDDSVTRLKGQGRPIVPEEDRARLLTALRSVDIVTVFPEDTPLETIRIIQPDVLVKGGDYNPNAAAGADYIVGSDIVRARGGVVTVIDLVEGRSTTDVIRKIQAKD